MAEIYFKDPKDYILLEFNLRKNRRPAYSMRAFARDLQFSPSSLNDFIKGRVGMSADRIEKLADFLKWSPERKLHFQDLIISHFESDKGLKQTANLAIKRRMKDKSSYFSIQEFNAISQWYHLVLIELCQLKDNITPAEISNLIGITTAEARKGLSNLLHLNILHETENGIKPALENTQFGDDAPSESIKNFHVQVLQQAQKSIFEKPMDERHNHSLIFTIPEAERLKMYDEIQKSLFTIVNKYAVKPNGNAVQIVSLQCFQVVAIDKSKKHSKAATATAKK